MSLITLPILTPNYQTFNISGPSIQNTIVRDNNSLNFEGLTSISTNSKENTIYSKNTFIFSFVGIISQPFDNISPKILEWLENSLFTVSSRGINFNTTIPLLTSNNFQIAKNKILTVFTFDENTNLPIEYKHFINQIHNYSMRTKNFILVIIKWNISTNTEITDHQIYFCRKLIDSGAHTIYSYNNTELSRVEIYNSGLIIYSLGQLNTSTNHRNHNQEDILTSVLKVSYKNDYVYQINWLPLIIKNNYTLQTDNTNIISIISNNLFGKYEK